MPYEGIADVVRNAPRVTQPMPRRYRAARPWTTLAAAALAVSALTGCGTPMFRGEGSLRLELKPPESLESAGSSVCLGVRPGAVIVVNGDLEERAVRGHLVQVSLRLEESADRADAGIETHLLVGLIYEGISPSAGPPGWQSTPLSELNVTLTQAGRSGRAEFTDLQIMTEADILDNEGGPPVETEGWPETLSGTLTWECGPLEEVPAP